MKFVIAALMMCSSFGAFAEDTSTVSGAVQEAGKDTVKHTKKMARSAKDKGCEMVNGKLECAKDKVKHKMQNGADEVKDKMDDVNKE